MWLKNWPLVPLCVCVWYQVDKQSSCFGLCPPFIDDVSVDATARPGSHVGSRCQDVIMKFFGTSYLHIPKNKKKRKLETNTPKTAAGWIWRTNVYVSDWKRTKRNKTNQAFWIHQVFILRSFGTRWVNGFCEDGCAQKPERWTELCVIFSYFQKSLIVIVTLREKKEKKNINVVLWWLILHDIVDFLFSFWFSFLTETLYHIFLRLAGKEKCLFVHITFKDILFFHCRNVKYNMRVCMCAYMLHTHTCIYI